MKPVLSHTNIFNLCFKYITKHRKKNEISKTNNTKMKQEVPRSLNSSLIYNWRQTGPQFKTYNIMFYSAQMRLKFDGLVYGV